MIGFTYIYINHYDENLLNIFLICFLKPSIIHIVLFETVLEELWAVEVRTSAFLSFLEKLIARRMIRIQQPSELSVKLSYLLDDYNVPTSLMKELEAVLIGISRLEKRGVVTRTQIRGKNLTSLASLKIQIATLSKQCMVEQPDSPIPMTDSTINVNDSDDNSSTKNKEDTQKSTSVSHQNIVSNNKNPIDMNLDNMTNQVLTLPRESRPIRLSEDNTIR